MTPLRWAARLLPGGVLRRLFDLAIPVYRFLAIRRRTPMNEHLRTAFGQDATPELAKRVARRFYTNAARHWLDNVMVESNPRYVLHGRVHGRNHLDDAIGSGKGVLIIGAHCFADRAAKLFLAKEGYAMLSVRGSAGRPRKANNPIVRMLLKRHTEFLHRVIQDEISIFDPECTLVIARRLRQGRLVSLYVDAGSVGKTISLHFLGGWRRFPLGMMDVVRITGCAVVPMFCRGDSRHLDITFRPAIEFNWSVPPREAGLDTGPRAA